jgi:YVTN family beta-propeller protein
MRTHNIQICNGFWWLGVLLGIILLPRVGCALIMQPAAATQSAKAYVGLFKDNAVSVVDTGTNRVLTTIPIPAGPHGLVVTPDGHKIYVSSDGASTQSRRAAGSVYGDDSPRTGRRGLC